MVLKLNEIVRNSNIFTSFSYKPNTKCFNLVDDVKIWLNDLERWLNLGQYRTSSRRNPEKRRYDGGGTEWKPQTPIGWFSLKPISPLISDCTLGKNIKNSVLHKPLVKDLNGFPMGREERLAQNCFSFITHCTLSGDHI